MNDEITQLQEMKKQRAAVVEMRDRLIRLYANPDFKAVFLKEYMVDEVARFMETAGNPNVPAPQRADALQQAYAPGCLKRWLDARLMMGDTAQEQMEEIDEEILEREQAMAMGDTSKYGEIGEADDEDGEGV